MAIKFQIRKKASNIWNHVKVDEPNGDVILSKLTIRWVGDNVEVTEESGVDNAVFLLSETAVYDDTDASTEETFATALEMAQRLKLLGYTGFYDDADLVIADLISGDASNILVLGTDGKLFVPTGGGGGGQVDSVVAGTNITVDNTDPINPIVSATGGGGDMTKAVYDPTNVNADAFDMDNMAEPSTAKTTPIDADTVSLWDSVSSSFKKLTWANIKVTLKAYFDTLYVLIADFLEENIVGTATEDATLTGTEDIDLETDVDAYYTLTGNTTITVSNTPSADTSFVRTWTVKSSATETLTLPIAWVVIGEYVADTSENYLTIRFSNYTTAGAKVICYISQDD